MYKEAYQCLIRILSTTRIRAQIAERNYMLEVWLSAIIAGSIFAAIIHAALMDAQLAEVKAYPWQLGI